jgi:hypothetical protein
LPGGQDEENLGPVAFFIEAGQPNAEFVKQTIEAVTDDYFSIASARVVKKRQYVPLQAADFLAHSFGVHDTEWLQQLVGEGYGKALHCHFKPDQIITVSKQVEDIWKRYRRMQDREKAAARRARANQAS